MISPYFANGDKWTKCDNPALRDGAKCWLFQAYFSFALQHHIEFIIIESINLGISENLNENLNKGGFFHIFIEKAIYILNLVFLKLLLFSFIGGSAATAAVATAVTFFKIERYITHSLIIQAILTKFWKNVTKKFIKIGNKFSEDSLHCMIQGDQKYFFLFFNLIFVT